MQRTTLSLIRNFAHPAYLVAIAFILKAIAVNMADSAYLAGLYTPISWAALAVFGIGLIFALQAGYQAWRWADGLDLACDCGGLLGSTRDGIRLPEVPGVREKSFGSWLTVSSTADLPRSRPQPPSGGFFCPRSVQAAQGRGDTALRPMARRRDPRHACPLYGSLSTQIPNLPHSRGRAGAAVEITGAVRAALAAGNYWAFNSMEATA